MRKVKIGFIGCGMVSELHYQGLEACPEVELTGIYDQDSNKLLERSKAWGVKAYSTLEELLNDNSIEAVFILTPLESHYSQAMAALTAGKHVLIEKPISVSLPEIERLSQLARANGLVCMPAHNYIYLPEMVRLKQNIDKGLLGAIPVSWIMYHVHHSEQMAARYPGVIRQIGTHLLYTHRYLFGEPHSLSAHTTSFLYPHLQREDQAMMTLTMPDGSLSNLFTSFAVSDHSSSPWTFIVKVLGTQGSTQLSWQDTVFTRAIGTMSTSYGKYEESYEQEINYFINECIIKGKPPLSTLEDAAAVLRLVEEAEASALNNKIKSGGEQ